MKYARDVILAITFGGVIGSTIGSMLYNQRQDQWIEELMENDVEITERQIRIIDLIKAQRAE